MGVVDDEEALWTEEIPKTWEQKEDSQDTDDVNVVAVLFLFTAILLLGLPNHKISFPSKPSRPVA